MGIIGGFQMPICFPPMLVTVLHMLHLGLEDTPRPTVGMVSAILLCNPVCILSSQKTLGTGFELIRAGAPSLGPAAITGWLLLSISALSWPQWEAALGSWWKAHGY